MYAGAVAVPLILGSAMGLTSAQVVLLINANLLTSGVATLIQTLGFWKFGARLPLIQGCSFIALAPMIMIGKEFGLSQIFGAVIAAGFITIALAPVFSRLLRFFPPVVIGSLITIIGISLMPAAAIWLGGGNPDAADFGNPANLLLGLATVSVTLAIYAKCKGFLGNLSVLIGLFVGSLIALSNVKSRFVVAAAGAIMVLMGLFPKLGALIAAVPTPVLGGCAIVMFGMTTVAGIQELSRVQFEGTRNGIIVAVSVSVGVLPMSFPALFEHVGPTLKLVLDSGIFLGAITAIALNILLNNEKKSTETLGAELAD
jgi:NCS2 family nucleobase:cation symporter-2